MGCVGWPASCNGVDYETFNNESLDARLGPHLTLHPFCSTCRVYVRYGIGSHTVRWGTICGCLGSYYFRRLFRLLPLLC